MKRELGFSILLVAVAFLDSLAALAGSAWIGNFSVNITRSDTGPLCDGLRVDTGEVVFDSWARTRAARTNLCFEIYVPGVTDRAELVPGGVDVFVNAPNKFSARFVERRGNNYLYLLDLRDLDPVPYGTSPSGNRKRALTLETHCTGAGISLTPIQVRFQ